jgi:eukaryotic-like serine/threonine-protein kinase
VIPWTGVGIRNESSLGETGKPVDRSESALGSTFDANAPGTSASDAGTNVDHGEHAHGKGETVELVPGQMFRGLRIRSLLGAGAMGNAYLASHASLRTPVVVKLFRVAGADPLAEAHLAARVVSPAVVPVLDAGVEAGVPYVIQRYVDGIDLEELLDIHNAADRSIPVPMLVRIAVDVFHGLSAIHIAGVVHRDIKPPNLFLAGSGESMVGDFGIAVDPNSTHRPEVAGTPMFIAPEMWAGESATPRTDLYSAAATLHLLWQRTPPFNSKSVVELAKLHREEVYKPPVTADPVGAYLGAVLARLLGKNPLERPESALATARILERILTPPPEMRGHDGNGTRIGDLSVHLEQRDICTADSDVIVNAANEKLEMRKGMAQALRSIAGDELERDAMAQGPITMGQVVWTAPYRLHCREVAHAAAALDGAICIQRAVLRTLFEAERRKHRSITFPALGTGVGGVPHGLGARLMLEAIRTFAAFAPAHTRSIRIALPLPDAMAAWSTALTALDCDTRA